MANWTEALKGDPVPWLLEDESPAIKHLALRWLLDRPDDDAELCRRAQPRGNPAP